MILGSDDFDVDERRREADWMIKVKKALKKCVNDTTLIHYWF
jgi:hypothetical protein